MKFLFRSKLILIRILHYILTFSFGRDECLCCGSLSPYELLCRSCTVKHIMNIVPPGEKRCKICGKILISEKNLCMACKTEPVLQSADGCFPLYSYRIWKKNLLFQWKLNGRRTLTLLFAKAIYRAIKMIYREGKIPVIVNVPPRPGKIKENGWDQIEELCRYLKELYGLRILSLLERMSRTQQKKLDRIHRLESKGKTYRINERKIRSLKGKNQLPQEVILLDDVITTGVTAESCCELLKKAGIARVQVLSIFIVD